MLVILDFNVAMEIHFIQFIHQFSNLTYFSYCHVLQYEPNLLKYYLSYVYTCIKHVCTILGHLVKM